MWSWIGEIFKWLGASGAKQRLDFESVTSRWESMFDTVADREAAIEKRLEEVEKQRDDCRKELTNMQEEAVGLKRKVGRFEDKLERALERIEHLEDNGKNGGTP